MVDSKQYKCVNCGEAAAALYKTYGPSVLKLTKCDKCNGIVDKYIEYDPVIVMIDLVLVSREAQRHVLYNTEFKAYWKLFIILIMIETYGLWRSDSLFNIAVNTICGIQTNSSTLNTTLLSMYIPMELEVPESFKSQCSGWQPEVRVDDTDLFIWERDFYIQFLSTFAGVTAFILTVHVSMLFLKSFVNQNEAHLSQLLKAFALAHVSILLTLPTLVWGAGDTPPSTRAAHYALVFVYGFTVYLNTFTVLYECPLVITTLILTASNCAKFLTTYHSTPLIRRLLQ
ncbi:ACAT-related protein required for viability 1 [Choristoneura fumiferana]|uniref:ACAT-related protein required for viability 1 n=1 Tax=Choristoneura fumiferana TaxID=7141 RepID=UPI003D1591C2